MSTSLLRAFRFNIRLRKSAPTSSGSSGLSFGLSATFNAGASLSSLAGASAGFSAGASASFSAGAGTSFSGGLSARASIGASLGGGNELPEALTDGGFQECSGLEIEHDVREHQEGGRNDRITRFVGRAKYVPIVLKRGMFYGSGGAVSPEIWRWIQAVVAGARPTPRYDGLIEVMSVDDQVAARWAFDRGLPLKVRGPELNARTGEVAIEELHIAHEALRLL